MEIENWMKQYCGAVRAAFGDRVRYIGLQGSRGREKPDRQRHRRGVHSGQLLSARPGDLSGSREGPAGPGQAVRLRLRYGGAGGLGPGELFQFRRDTTDWCGRLADLLPPEEPGDARRALHQGACGLYHLCCHNFLHGRSREAVAEACKAAVFLLQAKLYVEQGLYCRRRSDLEQHLTGQDLEILQTAQALKAGECREDLTALTDRLFAWCRDVIGQQKAI